MSPWRKLLIRRLGTPGRAPSVRRFGNAGVGAVGAWLAHAGEGAIDMQLGNVRTEKVDSVIGIIREGSGGAGESGSDPTEKRYSGGNCASVGRLPPPGAFIGTSFSGAKSNPTPSRRRPSPPAMDLLGVANIGAPWLPEDI